MYRKCFANPTGAFTLLTHNGVILSLIWNLIQFLKFYEFLTIKKITIKYWQIFFSINFGIKTVVRFSKVKGGHYLILQWQCIYSLLKNVTLFFTLFISISKAPSVIWCIECTVQIKFHDSFCHRMSFSSNLNHYGMVHVASVSDVLLDTSFTPPCQRMGAMVAFRSFQEFTRWVHL